MEILIVPNPILRKKANRLKKIQEQDIKIANKMMEIMNKAPGVGLAANQVGILKQIGAYKLAVEKIFPSKEVSCYILWTAIKKIDHLEKDLLDYDNLAGSTS